MKKFHVILALVTALLLTACGDTEEVKQKASTKVSEPSKVEFEPIEQLESSVEESAVTEPTPEPTVEPTEEPTVEPEEVIDDPFAFEFPPIPGMPLTLYMEEAWIDFRVSEYCTPDIKFERVDTSFYDNMYEANTGEYFYGLIYDAEYCYICITNGMTNEFITEYKTPSRHYGESGVIPDYDEDDFICMGAPIDDLQEYDVANSMFDEEQLNGMAEEFDYWAEHARGIYYHNSFNTALQALAKHDGYHLYEILRIEEVSPSYPFRIVHVRLDNALEYVVTESALFKGCMFIKVPSVDARDNILDYAYHLGD